MTNNPSAPLLGTLFISLLLGVSGCSSIIGATTDKPIKPNPSERTLGTILDDQRLETIVKVNLDKTDPGLKAANINVVAYNGIVLLTGQVANQRLRTLAGDTAARLPRARQVFNEIQIQGKTSMLARTNDAWLTTKVKTQLMAFKDIDSSHIKVVSEDGIIYLMGVITREQADKAVSVARSTGGVQKVVKAIEYLD